MDRSLLSPRHWPACALLLVMRAIAFLPLPVQLSLGRGIGSAAHLLARRRRHVTEVNVALCFPALSDPERRNLVRRIFVSTGIAAVETSIAFFRDPERYRERLIVEGLDNLEDAQAHGRGVVLIGAHFSTLDIAGALLSLVADIDVIYRADRNPVMEHALRMGRQRLHDGVIERKDVRTALKHLKAGRTVWYAADQDYGPKHSVFAPFFGVPAATITATARLARFNGSPAVFVSHFRDPERRRWTIRFSPAIEGFPSEDSLADATRINRMIEDAIRTHPDQYLWLHRRFKTRPPGQSRPYRAEAGRRRRARRPKTAA